MHRRLTDALARDIADWEHVRRVLNPDTASAALAFIEGEIERLRFQYAVSERPRVHGRRASDPKPSAPHI